MSAIAKDYANQFTAQATALLQQAKKYVSAEPATVPQWRRSPGQAPFALTGESAKLGLQYTALENKKAQCQRINKVVSAVIGAVVYHYGFWNQNPLWSCLVLPVVYAHGKVNEAISRHFDFKRENVRHQIARLNPQPT